MHSCMCVTFDEASPGFLVQPLDVPLLADVNGCVDEHFKELEARLSMELPGPLTVL